MNHLRREPALEELVNHALDAIGCGQLRGRIQVCWNLRMTTTAGLAVHPHFQIHLNPALRAIGEDEVRRTLLHELAHFVARARARGRRISPHGAEWQEACTQLGIPGETRCHNLPFSRRRQIRRFFYRCPCCGFVLERVRPLRRPSACLRCCRLHNEGKYDARFRFQQFAPEKTSP